MRFDIVAKYANQEIGVPRKRQRRPAKAGRYKVKIAAQVRYL
jgi:hypothetical protein